MVSLLTETPEPRLGDVKELADAMARQRVEEGASFSPIIFFIGAGCSVSAGVPTGQAIAQDRTRHLAGKYFRKPFADPAEAYNAMVRSKKFRSPGSGAGDVLAPADVAPEKIDWGFVYDQIFEDHIRAPGDVRKYFGSICDAQQVRLNWSHLCLGELVRQKHVSTVITTNFDQLVLTGLVQAGIIPAVSDGVESLNRIDTSLQFPQLIELHGSRHTYTLRNAKSDVAAVKGDASASGTLTQLFGNSGAFVVVGYAGREEGVMDLLIKAGQVYPHHEVVWVSYEEDPKRLGDKARQFLATTRNGRLIPGTDADEFFLELCRELGVGPPRALAEPLATLDELLGRIADHKSPDISAEIERARAMLAHLKQAQAAHRGVASENEEILRQGQELMLAGKHKRAYDLLDPAAERLNDPRVWAILGEAALELGRDNPEPALLRRSVEALNKATGHE